MPAGSILPFYMATPPVGWSRVGGIANTFGLRIVGSATAGGVSGGTDDPILNDKVPSHIHNASGATGNNSVGHSHTFSATSSGMSANASHSHAVSDPTHSHGGSVGVGTGSGVAGGSGVILGAMSASGTGISIASASTPHTHTVSGNTGESSAEHTHSFSCTTDANGSASNWVPRYMDFILCSRDAA
jgi:hypothetical protein